MVRVEMLQNAEIPQKSFAKCAGYTQKSFEKCDLKLWFDKKTHIIKTSDRQSVFRVSFLLYEDHLIL